MVYRAAHLCIHMSSSSPVELERVVFETKQYAVISTLDLCRGDGKHMRYLKMKSEGPSYAGSG
jgi:hypothetical protein